MADNIKSKSIQNNRGEKAKRVTRECSGCRRWSACMLDGLLTDVEIEKVLQMLREVE